MRDQASPPGPPRCIGRTGRTLSCTARGGGLAAELMRRAIAESTRRRPDLEIRLDAQARLASWYGRFGFEVAGAPFEEDGIPHVPMARAPHAPAPDAG
ncbi:GNAT family N-acetyltransferase [Microbacterium aquimaris]|uniref:GNAT family N-acetyltransferase n=1 Tax=Microbacterium aquimaris TaxID=459816 RepID=A0ABU5N897_9MICO|nr:GNAT family N-acetyltransferase [Microbacterium aquimaris]MDZ8162286.1 GNAT family N-acetyltransferase [Microbacterium aquimaris]